jgi:Serine dehydrogenase proteinase
MMDVFLYNGGLERGHDLEFIEFMAENKSHDKLLLILVTPGGNPDAAYKIGKYAQAHYDDFSCFIPGLCKSAGTLLAIAANQLIFSPFGELGPLDVQLSKTDDLFGQESGLNISEAFRTVEDRAKRTFHNVIAEIIQSSGGVVAFQTASHCASEIVASLYGPIFSRIDPEEVGSRARAMRLGEDYGIRLNQKFTNLQDKALERLSQSYSSHGFVIDSEEACALFKRVRLAEPIEQALVKKIGARARFPEGAVTLENHTDLYKALVAEIEEKDPANDPGENEEKAKDDLALNGSEGSAQPNGGNLTASE